MPKYINPNLTVGDLLTALVIVVSAVLAYSALRADNDGVRKDVARHEEVIKKLSDNERAISITQERVNANLEGITKLMEKHMQESRQTP